jgi:hypothetical protein
VTGGVEVGIAPAVGFTKHCTALARPRPDMIDRRLDFPSVAGDGVSVEGVFIADTPSGREGVAR